MLTTAGATDFGISKQVTEQSSKITGTVKNFINLASFSSDLGDETLEGVRTYHYVMKIDKTKIKSFITQSFSSLEQGLAAGMGEAIANLIGDTDIEVWIGKADFMVYGLKVNKALDFKEFTSSPDTKMSITFFENMSYPEINPPITLPDKPQDAKVALLPILKLQTIRNNLSQLEATAKSIFSENKSYSSLCSHSLLNGYQTKYGALLLSLNSGIVAQGAVKPACFAEKENFCISTQLADKSWLCVNKNGVIGKVKCIAPTTDCK